MPSSKSTLVEVTRFPGRDRVGSSRGSWNWMFVFAMLRGLVWWCQCNQVSADVIEHQQSKSVACRRRRNCSSTLGRYSVAGSVSRSELCVAARRQETACQRKKIKLQAKLKYDHLTDRMARNASTCCRTEYTWL